ncbi:MAG: outer membrane protein assembly factor BamD [Rhodospirillales bacterium]|jgi:outer membrane protein assembly factor BamD|nr:outer membrane protein assembly factor BamD [Rhodospirillales bacterium]
MILARFKGSLLSKVPALPIVHRRWTSHPFTLIVIIATIMLGACSGDDKEAYLEEPVDVLYNEAQNLMADGKYMGAARKFDEVERQHPYSKWATKAQLMSAYAYYEANEYDDSVIALDRFIQLHPSNKDVAYAYYLKALCYYEQISTVERDQEMTENATKTLNELITRFPNSKYSRDARLKLDLTFDHLAGKEMAIGRYYQGQSQHIAAINRFKTVIERYQTTTHVPEALLRMTESYLAVGLPEEAQKSASVLGHNFPGSEWYIDAYQLVEGKIIREEDIDDPWYKDWYENFSKIW